MSFSGNDAILFRAALDGTALSGGGMCCPGFHGRCEHRAEVEAGTGAHQLRCVLQGMRGGGLSSACGDVVRHLAPLARGSFLFRMFLGFYFSERRKWLYMANEENARGAKSPHCRRSHTPARRLDVAGALATFAHRRPMMLAEAPGSRVAGGCTLFSLGFAPFYIKPSKTFEP